MAIILAGPGATDGFWWLTVPEVAGASGGSAGLKEAAKLVREPVQQMARAKWVRRVERKRFRFLRVGYPRWLRFVIRAAGFEAVEFFDCAAVEAFGLGLIAQEQRPAVGLAGYGLKAFGQGEVAVLGAGDFDVSIAGEVGAHGDEGPARVIEGRRRGKG